VSSLNPTLNPIDAEDLYDKLLVGSTFSPGFVTIAGHDRAHGWDVKQASGSGGASTEYKGEEITEFTATFKLVKDDAFGIDEFVEWDAFQPILEKTLQTKVPQAIPIYHPDLIRNGITVVSVKKIGGMVHSGDGSATVTVTFLEFRPPKKKGGAPTAKKNDPNSDVKKELDEVVKAAKAA
jgi:hypothetical protein